MEASSLGVAVREWMEPVASILELFGVAVILLGVVLATIRFASDIRTERRKEAYDRYRANLGRGILLGLELLVAADIVATVALTPSFESLGILAFIVLIRTFLSFSLEVEIEGHWPWRRREMEARGGE